MLVGTAPSEHDWCTMVVLVMRHSLSTTGFMQYCLNRVGAAELSDLWHLCEKNVLVCLFVRSFVRLFSAFFLFCGVRGRSGCPSSQSSLWYSMRKNLLPCLLHLGVLRCFIKTMPHCHHHYYQNHVSYSICPLLAPLDTNRAASC